MSSSTTTSSKPSAAKLHQELGPLAVAGLLGVGVTTLVAFIARRVLPGRNKFKAPAAVDTTPTGVPTLLPKEILSIKSSLKSEVAAALEAAFDTLEHLQQRDGPAAAAEAAAPAAAAGGQHSSPRASQASVVGAAVAGATSVRGSLTSVGSAKQAAASGEAQALAAAHDADGLPTLLSKEILSLKSSLKPELAKALEVAFDALEQQQLQQRYGPAAAAAAAAAEAAALAAAAAAALAAKADGQHSSRRASQASVVGAAAAGVTSVRGSLNSVGNAKQAAASGEAQATAAAVASGGISPLRSLEIISSLKSNLTPEVVAALEVAFDALQQQQMQDGPVAVVAEAFPAAAGRQTRRASQASVVGAVAAGATRVRGSLTSVGSVEQAAAASGEAQAPAAADAVFVSTPLPNDISSLKSSLKLEVVAALEAVFDSLLEQQQLQDGPLVEAEVATAAAAEAEAVSSVEAAALLAAAAAEALAAAAAGGQHGSRRASQASLVGTAAVSATSVRGSLTTVGSAKQAAASTDDEAQASAVAEALEQPQLQDGPAAEAAAEAGGHHSSRRASQASVVGAAAAAGATSVRGSLTSVGSVEQAPASIDDVAQVPAAATAVIVATAASGGNGVVVGGKLEPFSSLRSVQSIQSVKSSGLNTPQCSLGARDAEDLKSALSASVVVKQQPGVAV